MPALYGCSKPFNERDDPMRRFIAASMLVGALAGFSGCRTITAVAPTGEAGKVYVTNGEARNEVRFEGPGVFGGSTVRGHLHEARITVLDGAGRSASVAVWLQ